MTCMYTFWWRHNILHLTYVPGFHTSGPQVPNTYFPYTFFFSKIQCCSRLVSEIYFHISNKKQSNYKMSYIWLCIFIPIIVSSEIYSNIWLNQELCPLWKKYPQHEVGGSYIVIKNSDAWALPDIELIYMVKKHFNYHKLWYLSFVFWDFSFKVCNTAWIMPFFCEK